MKKNKEQNKNVKTLGFEVFSRDDYSVTFKRVIPAKKRSAKEVKAIELGLPKVTVKYFEREDFFKLRKIGDEIYKTYKVEQKASVKKIITDFKDFVIK
jgi:hypothetical protein